MREILFRGKTESGRWAYGSLIMAGPYCCILESEEDVHPTDYPYLDPGLGTIDGKATPVIRETVGQFTGLTCKRGNKIFEGDVVTEQYGNREPERRFKVEFVPDRGGWYPFASGDGCGCCEDKTFKPNDDGSIDYIIDIGNIHDNPELLEEK